MHVDIGFSGHANVRALHTHAIEITRDTDLTTSGDCIVGVGAQMACSDLPEALKARLQDASARVGIRLSVDGMFFEMSARGDPALSLEHSRDIVIRTSSFACPRTIAVGCDASSESIPRDIIAALRGGSRGTLSVSV